MNDELKTETEKVDGTLEPEESTEDLKGDFVDEPEETSTDQAEAGKPEPETEEVKIFDQESANTAFIKNKKKLNAEKEAREKAEKEAAELKERIAAIEKGNRPEVPPIPEPFDDDYEQKIKEREAALLKAHEFDTAERQREDQKNAAIKEQQQKKIEADKILVDNYEARIKDLGLSSEILAAKENVLNAYIKDVELARFVVGMDDGPLVVTYLADNPVELEKISGMGAMQAAVHISQNVVPNAQKLRPETTQTPEPLTIPDGKGAPETESPYLKGGTFID